jgi:hypothetical protein
MSRDNAINKALIVTSIAGDTHPVLQQLARECREHSMPFIVIGDSKSPSTFELGACDYWSVERQLSLPFGLARITPLRHYSRKNLGYLLAISRGATELQETDDDNIPRPEFWKSKSLSVKGHLLEGSGWVNVYHYFTRKMIWPRGFPLEELQKKQASLIGLSEQETLCPIQQGLADENPDVDAVYRLTYPLPVNFEISSRLSLGRNSWSPFNSQNTYWYKDAFPLMYLPSYCSFRMTDIWRSYVAQRVAWECGWSVHYHEPTVWQERNAHDLMKDFADEIPGYTNNLRICEELQRLHLTQGKEHIYDNLVLCYRKLIEMNVVGKEEMTLLQTWISDLKNIT